MGIVKKIDVFLNEITVEYKRRGEKKVVNGFGSKKEAENWIKITLDPKERKTAKINEAVTTQMQCMECGRKFKKKIGPKTFEIKCPKCGSYDTEPI